MVESFCHYSISQFHFGFLNSMSWNPRSLNGQYHISEPKRDELKSQFENDGIWAGIYYPKLITENPPLRPFQGLETAIWARDRGQTHSRHIPRPNGNGDGYTAGGMAVHELHTTGFPDPKLASGPFKGLEPTAGQPEGLRWDGWPTALRPRRGFTYQMPEELRPRRGYIERPLGKFMAIPKPGRGPRFPLDLMHPYH
jgi:hypothetical protein